MAANPEILSKLKSYVSDKTGKTFDGDPPTGGDKDKRKGTPPERIPLPDYKNPASRLAYAKSFRQKYGNELLTGYGDIPLRVNEVPFSGSGTSKDLATKAAQAVGLDPALFYSSSMIEGQSGLYAGADKSLKSDEIRTTGDEDYPVSGLWNFGLDSFQDYLPTLKKKGYLPKDFEKTFKIDTDPKSSESVMFKNADAGIQAKAAMMRAYYDELDDYAKKKNIKLNPQQRDFFSLAHFNSGGHGYQMLDAYNKAGLLKNDDFLNKMPAIPIAGVSPSLHKQIYGNISPRLAAAKGLKKEGLFDDSQQQIIQQPVINNTAPLQQQVAPVGQLTKPIVKQRPIPEGAKVIETSEGKGYIDPHNGNFVKL